MALASIATAHEFLAEGAALDRWEWLDNEGREVTRLSPFGTMVRLRKRTDKGFVSCRIAVEDLMEFADVLPKEVFEC